MQTSLTERSLVLPSDLNLVTKSVFKFVQLPNESSTQATFRSIFETLGCSFLLLNRYTGFPSSSFGMRLCNLLSPPSHYKIESPQLTAQKVYDELRQLANNRFVFESIQISRKSRRPALELSVCEIAIALRRLLPKKIVFNNVQIHAESLQANLETDKKYYFITRPAGPMPSCTLSLQDKVPLLVLPSSPQDMVGKLERYARCNLRVRHLYFTAPVPERYEEQVANLLQKIAPTLQSLIMNESDFSTEALTQQLSSR